MHRRTGDRVAGLLLLTALFVNPLALVLHSLEHHHEDGEPCSLGKLLFLAATPESPPAAGFSLRLLREEAAAEPRERLDGADLQPFSARDPPLPL